MATSFTHTTDGQVIPLTSDPDLIPFFQGQFQVAVSAAGGGVRLVIQDGHAKILPSIPKGTANARELAWGLDALLPCSDLFRRLGSP